MPKTLHFISRSWEMKNLFSPIGWVLFFILLVHGLKEVSGESGVFYQYLGLHSSDWRGWGLLHLLSYGFVHGGFWFHLLPNFWVLWYFGRFINRVIGKKALTVILLSGFLCGGVGFLILRPAGILVGASGAAYALILASTVYESEFRFLRVRFASRNLAIALISFSALFTVMMRIDFNEALPAFLKDLEIFQVLVALQSIGHETHLFGGIAGWLVAHRSVRNRMTKERLLAQRKGDLVKAKKRSSEMV